MTNQNMFHIFCNALFQPPVYTNNYWSPTKSPWAVKKWKRKKKDRIADRQSRHRVNEWRQSIQTLPRSCGHCKKMMSGKKGALVCGGGGSDLPSRREWPCPAGRTVANLGSVPLAWLVNIVTIVVTLINLILQ